MIACMRDTIARLVRHPVQVHTLQQYAQRVGTEVIIHWLCGAHLPLLPMTKLSVNNQLFHVPRLIVYVGYRIITL